MEFVRKYIDASSLASIMTLPKALQNRKLEIIVLPAEDNIRDSKNASEINEIVNSLVGIIPNSGKSLDELRDERLKKYEIKDIVAFGKI